MREVRVRLAALLTVLALLSAACGSASAQQGEGGVDVEISQEAVQKVRGYVEKRSVGGIVVATAHAAEIVSHQQPTGDMGPRKVKDRNGRVLPGRFGLIYDFRWKTIFGEGETRMAFLCDSKGNIYGIQMIATDAGLPSFTIANVVLDNLRGNLKQALQNAPLAPEIRRQLTQAIDSADGQALLVLVLKNRLD